MTSTSEMALIDSDNHGYGTDAWLHYMVNDIIPQKTQVYIVAISVKIDTILQNKIISCKRLVIKSY